MEAAIGLIYLMDHSGPGDCRLETMLVPESKQAVKPVLEFQTD